MKLKYLPIKTIVVIILPVIGLGACTANLKRVRAHYASEKIQTKIEDVSNLRSQQISDGSTFYGKKLTCLSDMHKDFFVAAQQAALANPQLSLAAKNGRFRMSVAPIRDKTGKVFENNTTVLSDMVLNAVAQFKHFDVIETPLSPDGFADSRNNFLDPRYNMLPGLIQNFSATMTSLQHLPVGVLFPSNYYITGALTQFDENNEVPTNKNLNLDANVGQGRYGVQAITATVDLRLVDAWTGTVVRIEGTDDLATVRLTNTFYTMRTGANFFRLIGTKDYGIDYSVTVGDPKMAATKEMVDKGVYELLNKFLKPFQVKKDQSC